jgi:hypothetical protein
VASLDQDSHILMSYLMSSLESLVTYEVFKKYLPTITSEHYSPWLTTFFVCLAYGKSIEDLYTGYSFVDKTGLASLEEYKSFWKDISLSCLDVSGSGRPKAWPDVKPFWLHVQDALNGLLHEQCFEGFSNGSRNKKMVVDDDKLHYETIGTDEENTYLKKMKHLSNNRWGHPCTFSLWAPSMFFGM